MNLLLIFLSLITLFHFDMDVSVFKGIDYEFVRVKYADGLHIDETSRSRIGVPHFDLRELERIGEIEYIIHNHFKSPEPSRADLWIYRYLKKRDFRGRFLIYYDGKIYELI